MKKVVMFAGPQHEIPPTKGAAVQTWIYEVSKRLITYQTHIISISHEFLPIKDFSDGIYFHRVHLSKSYKRIFQKILGWDLYSYNKRVFNIIRKINPDVVHIHNYYDAKEIIKWIKIFNPNIKIIFHMHNLSDKFNKKEFPKVDIFVGCSNFITEHYKLNNLIKADDFVTIYNGVDNEKFDSAIELRENIKEFISVEENKKNIFYFGRISEEKGVDKILEIAKLFKYEKQFRFYCVGEISKDGDRKKYFDNIKKEIEIDKLSNIVFLNFIAPKKIHLAYQLADMVIVPSKFEEPFCMVAIEAMASNIPTVCAYKGGMKEYLENDKNAIVVDNYENFSQIACERIVKYFKEKDNQTIINAKKMVKERFDWINIASRVENAYNI
jgi:glycosyltransferase involved in cell wall biosynthesis